MWSRLALTPERKAIAYCGAGPYAAFDLFALHLLGHENAALYDRAWLEWGARADLPVEVGPERDRPKARGARPMHVPEATEDAMATDNIALVKRLVDEVWNKGNLKVADELSSSTSGFHDPMSGDLTTLDAFKKHVQNVRTGFPDMRVAIDDIAVSGDKVYMRWTVTGTHKGPFMGADATNKRGVTPGMSVSRIQGGKIAETWMFYDVLGLLQQLGLAPAMREEAAGAGAPASVH